MILMSFLMYLNVILPILFTIFYDWIRNLQCLLQYFTTGFVIYNMLFNNLLMLRCLIALSVQQGNMISPHPHIYTHKHAQLKNVLNCNT